MRTILHAYPSKQKAVRGLKEFLDLQFTETIDHLDSKRNEVVIRGAHSHTLTKHIFLGVPKGSRDLFAGMTYDKAYIAPGVPIEVEEAIHSGVRR